MKRSLVICSAISAFLVLTTGAGTAAAALCRVNTRSCVLVDSSNGRTLYEQDADKLIPPASITKVLTLYIVFDAIREGRTHLWESVSVSERAASTGGSRMNLRAGSHVSLQELINGIAIVSANDGCVAVAEHLSGSVEAFVRRMNAKARELGMVNTVFMTPNGLPAKGQVTTARDISKLSLAYLRRYPEALNIHSMTSYTYNNSTHRNANRLLGKCPGVDGIKTGFVCASGYNISATAKRGDVRLIAVVMGANSPGIRAAETEKLLEAGFRALGSGSADVMIASSTGHSEQSALKGDLPGRKTISHRSRASRVRVASAQSYSAPHKGVKTLARNSKVLGGDLAPASKRGAKPGSSKITLASSGKGWERSKPPAKGSKTTESIKLAHQQSGRPATAVPVKKIEKTSPPVKATSNKSTGKDEPKAKHVSEKANKHAAAGQVDVRKKKKL